MSGSFRVLAASVILGAGACTDFMGGSENTLLLSEAFQTVPAGFSATSQSFETSADAGAPFMPGVLGPMTGFHGGSGDGRGGQGGGHGGRDGGDHRDGMGPGLRGLLMGGGLGPDFIGAIGFGHGRGRGPFGTFRLSDDCTFSATTGRVTCPDSERHGLTVSVSFAFKDAAGTAQAKFDTVTTNSVNVQTSVEGTKTRHDGRITSVLDHASDRTVTGLAAGSTQRTVNGTSKAMETTTGARDDVQFTAVRVAGDTTSNVVIQLVDGRPTIPKSGTVIRAMTVTVTPQGGTATTKTRREVVTFDGTNVVKVAITQDGETRNCTITLPGRRLVCE